MASATEYNMMFRLQAQLGNAFNGTFSKAQRQMQDLQRKMTDLHKVQSDISAYEKQRAAVASTERKLSDLQQQYDNIQREMQETGTYSSALENKLIEKKAAIDKATEALQREKEKLTDLDTGLKNAGVNTENLANESKELQRQQEELSAQYDKASKEAENFGVKGANAFSIVGEALIAAGIYAGLKEIYGAYKECVEIQMTFESTLSTVEALSGATADEMSLLTQKAKELGATTKFTATEAGKAMTYMGMAGWSAEEMLNGMDGVLQLAAASGEDLAEVSDIVTDNLTAFGLKASDTAHFSDVLAVAATASNTSVGMMGETFSNCAPQAGALGYSIEDVAIATGIMANAGIKGSRAGTALKNIFTAMAGEITFTCAALGDVTYSAIKSDGTMKSFGETINDLRGYFAQMTAAEKIQNAQMLVGDRAMAGFVSLMNSAEDDVDSLTEKINDCTGAAQRMADIQLDNLQGQVTLMNSAADALRTTLGEQFNPELRVLSGLWTDILNGLNSFVEKHPYITKGIMAIVGAGTAALAVFVTYKTVKSAILVLKKANALLTAKEAAATGANTAATVAETAALVANEKARKVATAAKLGVAGALIAVLAVAAKKLSDESKEYLAKATELNNAIQEFDESVQGLNATYDETISKTEAQATVAQSYIDKLKELEAQGAMTTEQQKEYAKTVEKLRTLMPDLNLELDAQTGKLKDGTTAIEEQITAWKEKIKLQALENVMTETLTANIQFEVEVEQAKSELQNALDEMSQYYNDWGGLTIADVPKLMDEWYQDGGLLDPTRFERTGTFRWSKKGKELRAKAGTATEIASLYNTLQNAEDKLSASQDDVDKLTRLYNDAIDGINLFDETVSESGEKSEETAESYKEQIAVLDELCERYKDAKATAIESITSQYKLWDTAAVVIPNDINDVNTALETQMSYWYDYNQDIQDLLARAVQIEGLNELVAEFGDGSAESVNMIAGMAAASDEDLELMIANWKALKEQQEETGSSLTELEMGFKMQVDSMQTTLAEAVDSLDLSEASGYAAKKTMQSYIDEMNAGTMSAVETASKISELIKAALEGDLIPFLLHQGSDGGGVDRHGGIGNSFVAQYAGGTESAASGWAIVGENGPELMRMHGGETVISAEKTEALLRGNSSDTVHITVSPTFHVEGGGDDIEKQLRACEARITELVIDTIRDAGIDARRNAYT
ncbi:MAG: phage tail tape measure protein [Christensenellales bacterium]